MRAALTLSLVVLLSTSATARSQVEPEPEPKVEPAPPLERALGLFRAGDFTAAAPLLERAHAGEPGDLDITLLLGIAYLRTGRPADARPLLLAAAESRDAETASSARLFLGLVARDEGDEEEARVRFAEVAASSVTDLAAPARGLLAPAEEPLSLYLLVRPELDSNVPLAPSALIDTGAEPSSDGSLLLLGAAEGCLGDADRICAGDTLLVRRQLKLSEYDTLANTAALRYRRHGADDQLAVAYSFEAARRGGSAFATGHVGDASWRHRLDGPLSLVAAVRLAQRSYSRADYAPLDGPSLEGQLGVRWSRRRAELQLAATPLREWAERADLSAAGAGARVDARLPIAGPLEAQLLAATVYRRFDRGREDVQFRGELLVVVSLGDHVGLLAGASGLANLSSDRDYDLRKWTTFLGVDLTLAGP